MPWCGSTVGVPFMEFNTRFVLIEVIPLNSISKILQKIPWLEIVTSMEMDSKATTGGGFPSRKRESMGWVTGRGARMGQSH